MNRVLIKAKIVNEGVILRAIIENDLIVEISENKR
jgi:hypothetical protein